MIYSSRTSSATIRRVGKDDLAGPEEGSASAPLIHEAQGAYPVLKGRRTERQWNETGVAEDQTRLRRLSGGDVFEVSPT